VFAATVDVARGGAFRFRMGGIAAGGCHSNERLLFPVASSDLSTPDSMFMSSGSAMMTVFVAREGGACDSHEHRIRVALRLQLEEEEDEPHVALPGVATATVDALMPDAPIQV
jgi:hypothetical protein